MNPSKTLIAILLSLGATAPYAEGLPTVKTGNWDMTVSIAGQPGTSVQKVCRAQPSYNPGESLERMEKAGMTCSRKDLTSNGSVVTMDYLCKLRDTEIVSHSETTLTGDSALHSEIHTRYRSATGAVLSEVAVVVDGKWTGPCTEGQTPE
jgi:hypothetical protein